MPQDLDYVSPWAGLDVADWLIELAERRGPHQAIVWAPFEGDGYAISYRSLLDRVQRLAGGLQALGVRPGDRVLVHLENCPETVLLRFACAWLGAVCVATNAVAVGVEVGALARASRAVCAFTHRRLLDEVRAHGHTLREVHAIDADGPAGQPLAAFLAEPLPRRPADPALPAAITFTTGSTGTPKGVVWTHANVLWAAQLNAQQQGIRPDDVHLLFLPLYHVVGLAWCLLSTLWAGGTVVLQPRFSRSRYWPAAVRHRATVGSHVPFTSAALRSGPVPAHRFRLWIHTRHDAALARHFGVALCAGWGMTEMLTQVIVSDPQWQQQPGGLGRPSPAYAVRVVDEEGRPVPPGSTGALLVRGVPGLSIFAGYDGDEAAARQAFDEQGFFRTGDRVRLDAGGWLHFEERAKDVIKVGGENVSAVEVEQVVLRTPGIAEAAAVAAPDPMYGESVAVFVTVAGELAGAGAQAVARAVQAQCEQRLSPFKRPRQVQVLPALPRIGIGKVAKNTLRDLLRGQGEVRVPRSSFAEDA